MVKRAPETSPKALARLDHDPPDGRHVPFLPGPPWRRGGEEPVNDAAEVEARRHQHRRPGEVLAVAPEYVAHGPVRDREPAPVDDGQAVVDRAHAAVAAQRLLKTRRRTPAEPERAVGVDRIVDPEPPHQRLGVVVGHVVVDEVGPYLQGIDTGVAQW